MGTTGKKSSLTRQYDSLNSIQSFSTENNEGAEVELEKTEFKQLSYDLQDDLNLFFASFRDDGKSEKERKLEEQFDKLKLKFIYKTMNKANSKNNISGKTGKFKKHCKLAKYQNKEFLDEPIIETPFNREANYIDDWFMR